MSSTDAVNAPGLDASSTEQDLGPLAWVLDELRKSLEGAVKAMRRFVRDAEIARQSDLASLDAGPLRIARQQLHQAGGALEMVGMEPPALLVRALESAVQRFVQRPELCSDEAAEVVERASFAVIEFLEHVLAGKSISPVALFPQYRDAQRLAGSERIHPADLWSVERRLREPELALPAQALAYDGGTRAQLDSAVLRIVKTGDPQAAAEVQAVCAGLAAAQEGQGARVFWKVCAGFFEALAQQALKADVYVKRVASRVLMQYASLARGDAAINERLLHDLLFFCAHAHAPEAARAPALAAVRRAMGLAQHPPVDYEKPRFGLHDPAVLAQARKRMAAATETWSALAGGERSKLKPAADQFSLVCDSLRRLHPDSEGLAQALERALEATTRSGEPPSAALAMEVATAVLYLQASFEDLDGSRGAMAERAARLAQRLDSVVAGGEPQPLEPWMEELYRRVSDHQTMGSVVDELRASLADVENCMDQYFRDPGNDTLLGTVPPKLQQMRGVLSVLGLDQASLAVARMRELVEALMQGGIAAEAQPAVFERIGNSLGALGFLIDMLGYQRALARKLFVYDEEHGELRSLMGRAPAQAPQESEVLDIALVPDEVPAPAAAAPEPAAAQDEPPVAPQPAAAPAAPAVDEDDDGELLDIFLEEAREVVGTGLGAVATLEQQPGDLSEQTTLRRAFHTLKGSSRMVGLNEFGEAAWSMEQVLNAWLAEQKPVQPPLLQLSKDALQAFGRWADDIVAGQAGAWQAQPFAASADAMRLDGALLPLSTPGGSASPDALPAAVDEAPAQPEQEAADEQPDFDAPTAPMDLEFLSGAPAAKAPVEAVLDEPLLDFDFPAPVEAVEAAPETAPIVAEPEVAKPEVPAPSEELPAIPLPDAPAQADGPAGPQTHEDDDPAEPAPDFADTSLEDDESPEEASAEGAPLAGLSMDEEVDFALFEQARQEAQPPRGDDTFFIDPERVDIVLEPAEPEEPQAAPTAEAAQPVEAAGEPEAPQAVPAEPAEATDFDAELADWLGSATGVDVDSVVTGTPQEPPQPEVPDAAAAVEWPEPVAEVLADAAVHAEPAIVEDEAVKVIEHLRIGLPLYTVYLNEADEWSRRLVTALQEWELELHRPAPDLAVALAHSLAGSSATVGFVALSELSRALEHALQHLQLLSSNEPAHARTANAAAEEIRRLLHQFAAGFLKEPNPQLLAQLAAILDIEVISARAPLEGGDGGQAAYAAPEWPEDDVEPSGHDDAAPQPAVSLPPAPAPIPVPAPAPAPVAPPAPMASDHDALVDAAIAHAVASAGDIDDDIDVLDVIDPDLFPIFEEEALELLPQLGAALRQWCARPDNLGARSELLRALHTLKGSARLAGAMRLGEMAHRLESAVEQIDLGDLAAVRPSDLEPLQSSLDVLQTAFEALRTIGAQPLTEPVALAPVSPAREGASGEAVATAAAEQTPGSDAVPAAGAAPQRVAVPLSAVRPAALARPASGPTVRVRSGLLDRLVNQAGEVMIARSRLETRMGQLRSSLGDLTGNLERLRQQLRDIEVQAETQMQSRLALSKDLGAGFDPLEFDRFTRVQELTRMMAESVNDVATVQRNMQRAMQGAEDDLIAQGRQARELQRDLLRTRMVEFESISERLYALVRQASKETGKQIRLDIAGGSIEMDRGVLDRMTPAFEHLLRNSIGHGIEASEARVAAGKPAVGTIAITVRQEGNDVSVEFRDDGSGLDLGRIRAKAVAQGLIAPDTEVDERAAGDLIFAQGFSTAAEVTGLSGRGIGMDVVRAEVQALGGRIETETRVGRGTSFRMLLPLTTAVTQVVMLRAGELTFGVPANLVEIVRRSPVAEMEQAYASHRFVHGDEELGFYWAGALLQSSAHSTETAGRTRPVVVLRSAAQRVAMHVDEVLGNQEVVVKNLGPQLSRLPGLAGMSVLASGAVVLIYNPVALATVYGEQLRATTAQAPQAGAAAPAAGASVPVAAQSAAAPVVPLVLVVDDSITVRRVTQRLLAREGYRVALAADGLQALERLQEERPAVVLSDIEMPRMDGFDLARNIRSDEELRDLPIIMITSRIAQKHRDHAMELGVNHYLGKPYSDEELLNLVEHYAQQAAQAVDA